MRDGHFEKRFKINATRPFLPRTLVVSSCHPVFSAPVAVCTTTFQLALTDRLATVVSPQSHGTNAVRVCTPAADMAYLPLSGEQRKPLEEFAYSYYQ